MAGFFLDKYLYAREGVGGSLWKGESVMMHDYILATVRRNKLSVLMIRIFDPDDDSVDEEKDPYSFSDNAVAYTEHGMPLKRGVYPWGAAEISSRIPRRCFRNFVCTSGRTTFPDTRYSYEKKWTPTPSSITEGSGRRLSMRVGFFYCFFWLCPVTLNT